MTNRKSHTGFRLVPTSVTLNAIIALILHYFIKIGIFAGRLRHSGWRWTYNVRKICSPSYIWPKL